MQSPGRLKHALGDQWLAAIISVLLGPGVSVSAGIVFFGGVLYLVQHYADPTAYSSFHLEQSDLRNIRGILHSAMGLQPDAIVQFGLVVLIATPLARVVLAAIGFYLEKDRLYLAVSFVVLAVLSYSLFALSNGGIFLRRAEARGNSLPLWYVPAIDVRDLEIKSLNSKHFQPGQFGSPDAS
jgi:uncharacterized membrane protein